MSSGGACVKRADKHAPILGLATQASLPAAAPLKRPTRERVGLTPPLSGLRSPSAARPRSPLRARVLGSFYPPMTVTLQAGAERFAIHAGAWNIDSEIVLQKSNQLESSHNFQSVMTSAPRHSTQGCKVCRHSAISLPTLGNRPTMPLPSPAPRLAARSQSRHAQVASRRTRSSISVSNTVNRGPPTPP